MALETATYISGLNANNPVGASDPKSQGDDHLRLIKATLLNTFPGVTGPVLATHTELNYLDNITGVTGSGNLVLSASPTFSGTAAFAGITCSGIVAGGSIVAPNLPGLNLANVFTMDQAIERSGVVASLAVRTLTTHEAQLEVRSGGVSGGYTRFYQRETDSNFGLYYAPTGFTALTLLRLTPTTVTLGDAGRALTLNGNATTFGGARPILSTQGGMLNNALAANSGGKITITNAIPGSAAAVGAPGDMAFVY